MKYDGVVEVYGYATLTVEADSVVEAEKKLLEQVDKDEIPLGPKRVDELSESGLTETPKSAVALADGRTPEEAAEVREQEADE